LYFTARLHTAQCEPEKAITCLQRALDLQLEYVQLQHMCLVCHFGTHLEYRLSHGTRPMATAVEVNMIADTHQWDYALDYMMINNWKGALDCFSILREESNWSRAVYT
jgi:hypothetical protein